MGAGLISERPKPGPRNDITDVPGISVGQAHDAAVNTGVSVIVPADRAVCAVDVRGGGPGTRETDLLDPSTLVDAVDAIVLSGGSSYGLAAADGAAALLGARGRGFQLIASPGVPPSPIAPSAILYDLANGGDKNWGENPPYQALGKAACEDALSQSTAVALGRAGAGYGARAGVHRGGIGSASYITRSGLAVGAFMAVNSFGSVKMAETDAFWAWPYEEDGEFGGARPPSNWRAMGDALENGLPSDTKLASPPPAPSGTNTTLGVVAISAPLSQADAQRIAIMAQDGMARAIRPVHGPTDGDVIFVLSTGSDPADGKTKSAPAPQPTALDLTAIGSLAADCVARAIARSVYEAEKSP